MIERVVEFVVELLDCDLVAAGADFVDSIRPVQLCFRKIGVAVGTAILRNEDDKEETPFAIPFERFAVARDRAGDVGPRPGAAGCGDEEDA